MGNKFDPITGNKAAKIMYQGRIVLRKSEITNIISSFIKETKNDGSRKLIQRIKVVYVGITENDIDKEKRKDSRTQILKPQFKNVPPMKPITADCPMAINQVDIVDLSAFPSTYKGLLNKYVLSLIDVFSRFLWLTPLPSKDSATVAEALYNIYLLHGPPRVLQCDQGGEFKGTVKSLMNKLGTRIINSRAYHPQSQGKVSFI